MELIVPFRVPMEGNNLRAGPLAQMIEVAVGNCGPTNHVFGFLAQAIGVMKRELQSVTTTEWNVPLFKHEEIGRASLAAPSRDYSVRNAGNGPLQGCEQRLPRIPLTSTDHGEGTSPGT